MRDAFVAKPQLLEAKPVPKDLGDDRLYHFAVLPGTRLWFELALDREPIKLAELTCVLQRDPVAVQQLYAAAADDLRTEEEEIPYRLEDALATLGREQLRQVFCRQAAAPKAEQIVLLAYAQRAFRLGRLCREVAQMLGLDGEQAFLVGLLHDVGSLPSRLGRTGSCSQGFSSARKQIERVYKVPQVLRRALDEANGQQAGAIWRPILYAAQHLESQLLRERGTMGANAIPAAMRRTLELS